MRALLIPALLLATSGAGEAAGADAYANWQRCLRRADVARPPAERCAGAEAAYLRALTASPLLDPSDIARSRTGLRAQAMGGLDPATTGSIGPRRAPTPAAAGTTAR